ncbi:MAG: hypothetical protein ACYCW6_17205 [Candidatus Xenobia bacterium]
MEIPPYDLLWADPAIARWESIKTSLPLGFENRVLWQIEQLRAYPALSKPVASMFGAVLLPNAKRRQYAFSFPGAMPGESYHFVVFHEREEEQRLVTITNITYMKRSIDLDEDDMGDF